MPKVVSSTFQNTSASRWSTKFLPANFCSRVRPRHDCNEVNLRGARQLRPARRGFATAISSGGAESQCGNRHGRSPQSSVEVATGRRQCPMREDFGNAVRNDARRSLLLPTRPISLAAVRPILLAVTFAAVVPVSPLRQSCSSHAEAKFVYCGQEQCSTQNPSRKTDERRFTSPRTRQITAQARSGRPWVVQSAFSFSRPRVVH